METMCKGRAGIGIFVGIGMLFGTAVAAPRDVMIRSIDTVNRILELHNFGSGDEDLSGYQFCSHDENQILEYSSASGLNGANIEAGTSIFVHFNNDAPADPDHLNISSMGGSFAGPLDNGPFSISLYFPPLDFDDGGTMASHLQWSIDGADNAMADERSDEAQSGGLWTNQSLWVSTNADTTKIALKPGAENSVLHAPEDYNVFGPSPDNPLAVALCGDVAHYAWVRLDGGGGNANIIYRNCTVGGPCGPTLKLVGASTSELNPAMACDGATVLVAWEDYRDGNADIAYRRSTDGGTSFGALEFLVRAATEETKPVLGLSGGVALVAWEDTRRGNKDLGFRRSTDGGLNWDTFVFLVRSPFDDSEPDLAHDGDLALLSWVDHRHGGQDIAYRRSTNAGLSWAGLTFAVRAATLESDPTVALDTSTNTALVGWVDTRTGNQELAARRSSDGGASFAGLTFLVRASTDDSEPVLRVSGNDAVLSWVDLRSGNNNISYRHSGDGGATWAATARLVSASTDEFSPACDLLDGLAICGWQDTRTGVAVPMARDSLTGGASWLTLRALD